ncbi:MAG: hypothetical protein ACK43J_03535 [Chitinophagaceae bacterium]|jgi:gliding motility-associated lipoprotein GldD
MNRLLRIFSLQLVSAMLVTIMLSIGCNTPFTPRPKGYFTVDLPEKEYRVFDSAGFPYSFEYPTYATIVPESDSASQQPYWINIDFKEFNGRIYISYKPIQGQSIYKVKTSTGYRDSVVQNSFEQLREESYKLTYKHTVRASAIVDSFFTNPNGVSGIFFYVAGNAATSKQFFVTDTSRHFLRAALYFDATPNEDSLSMTSEFIARDMRHLINTFRWK